MPLSLVDARPRGRTRTGVEVACSPAVSDGTCEAACACRITRVCHSSANSEVVSDTSRVAAAAVGRGCLLAPSTAITPPPAATLPQVVSNMRFANSLLGILIESARVDPRSRRGVLSTIMNHSKSTHASWCVTHTPERPGLLFLRLRPAHKPSRRCVASV